MLRFLSRRKGRGTSSSGTNQSGDAQTNNTASQIKSQRILTNKNQIECRVILLDGTDLSVYLTVSTPQAFIKCKQRNSAQIIIIINNRYAGS